MGRSRAWMLALIATVALLIGLWLSRDDDPSPPATAPPADVAPTLGRIAGVVIDSRDGTPLAGARIQIDAVGRKRSWISSDKDGRFDLRDLEPGLYTLRADAEGWRPSGRDAETLEINLEPGDALTDRTLALVEGAGLRAQVELVDAPGAGELQLSYLRDGSGATQYTLDPIPIEADGDISLDNLAPGEIELEVIAPGHVMPTPIAARLVPGEVEDIGVIRLISGAIVRGAVVDPAGRPLEGAVVEVIDGNAPDDPLKPVKTNTIGDFEILGIEGSWATLRFSAASHRPQRREVRFVVGEVIQLGDITLDALSGLVVQVSAPDGEDVSGATVAITVRPDEPPLHEVTTTGVDVVIDELRGGPYLAQATHPLFGPSRQEVVSAGEVVSLTLGDPNRILGAIRGADGATANVVLKQHHGPEGGPPSRVRTLTTSEGGFAIDKIASGSYLIEVSAAGLPIKVEGPLRCSLANRSMSTSPSHLAVEWSGQ